jgi:hypothetical protein
LIDRNLFDAGRALRVRRCDPKLGLRTWDRRRATFDAPCDVEPMRDKRMGDVAVQRQFPKIIAIGGQNSPIPRQLPLAPMHCFPVGIEDRSAF